MAQNIPTTGPKTKKAPGVDRFSGQRTAFFLLVAALFLPQARAADPPPNFVFILIDDLGQRDLGCYGSTFYETPHVDALAAGGVRFTSAYAACPVCSPTRASIQSGKYPARLRTTDYFGGPQPEEAATLPRFKHRKLLPAPYREKLPLEEVTVAERLKDAGYATFFTGKWHLGGKGYWPQNQGYEINLGGNRAGHSKTYFSPYNNPQLPDGPKGEQIDERLASETAKFILEHRDRPFFAFFSQFDVHVPLQTKPELEKKYAAKAKQLTQYGPRLKPDKGSDVRQVQDHPVYAGMVETMDASVGIVLDALEKAGVADRTVVIFTSDNGGLSTKEGSPTSNVPLRAGKGWMYEGGVRVPLVVRWPGAVKPGSVCDSYMSSVDYLPTILELAGLGPQPNIDGKSFAPLLRGEQDFQRGPVYWHYPHYGNQGGVPASAVRDGDWKLIEFFEDGRLELYNLAQDLSEQHDLAGEHPERVKKMHEQLQRWRDEVDAVMPSPNPNAT